MSQLKIHSPSSIQLDQLCFDKLYHTKNGVTKATVTYQGQPLMIQGPKMTFGTDVMKSGDYYYMDLVFKSKHARSREASELIKNIDYSAISEIFDSSEQWYQSADEVGLCQIEKEFIPTLKLSTIYPDRECLKLAVKVNDVEFYDQDGLTIPYLMLKEGYETIPLLQLVEVIKDEGHIWAEWKVFQLKTEVPMQVFKSCQLVDVVESEEECETCEEDPDFY